MASLIQLFIDEMEQSCHLSCLHCILENLQLFSQYFFIFTTSNLYSTCRRGRQLTTHKRGDSHNKCA